MVLGVFGGCRSFLLSVTTGTQYITQKKYFPVIEMSITEK